MYKYNMLFLWRNVNNAVSPYEDLPELDFLLAPYGCVIQPYVYVRVEGLEGPCHMLILLGPDYYLLFHRAKSIGFVFLNVKYSK